MPEGERDHEQGSEPAAQPPASGEVEAEPGPSESSATASAKEPFTFTDPGCRSEIRLGVLLILVAVFLWLWLGPAKCSILFLAGLPLVLIGVPIQAWQARTEGRPGYPLKLGLVLTIGALLMWPDLRYRETVGGPVSVQPLGPMLLIAGLWMVAWWPVARTGRGGRPDPVPGSAAPASGRSV